MIKDRLFINGHKSYPGMVAYIKRFHQLPFGNGERAQAGATVLRAPQTRPINFTQSGKRVVELGED